MTSLRALLSLGALLTLGGAAPGPGPRVAVLTIDLNNIHKTAPDTALPGRLTRLGEALRTRLAGCGYDVVVVDAEAEGRARATDGYFYEHVDVAAALASQADAEWVVVPRLNRATAWVADLQAQVVRVSDTTLVSNRIVELKGLELAPELAARLVDRGAAWMADQLAQAIEHSRHPAGPGPRRCPP
jgi:hypothetical protein